MPDSTPNAALPSGANEGAEHGGLQRGLRNRHIQLIALGGSIGLGLFLSSGAAIRQAGPALLLSYAVGGVMFFFLLRALGELALYRPVSGSFASYATEFIGPFAGFFTGWTYWGTYVVVGMAELTAIGKYIDYWWPGVPQWIPALVGLVVLVIANIYSVRVFGEAEFWFAIIKVLAIVALILTGIAVLTLGISELSAGASVANLFDHGGFFPRGALKPLLALQVVVFSFFGLETIGIAAGEADNPQRSLPKAINQVIFRIAIFYIGSLAIIMSLIAWNKLNPTNSPFVFVFDHLGLPAAASVINFVVITAAVSAGNAALFVTARMLYSLSQQGHAPKRFEQVSSRRVPHLALALSAALMLVAVIVNYVAPDRALAYIMALATLGGLTTWIAIMVAHNGYRRAVKKGLVAQQSFRMPGAPWTNMMVLLFIALVIGIIASDEAGEPAVILAPCWVAFVSCGYWLLIKRRKRSTVSNGQL